MASAPSPVDSSTIIRPPFVHTIAAQVPAATATRTPCFPHGLCSITRRFFHHHSSPVRPYNRGRGTVASGDSNGEKADVEAVATDSDVTIIRRRRLFLLPMSSS